MESERETLPHALFSLSYFLCPSPQTWYWDLKRIFIDSLSFVLL